MTESFDVLCFSHLRWDYVYQRPQHLLSRCANQHRVFFVEEPVLDGNDSWLEVSSRGEGLTIVVPHIPESTSPELRYSIQRPLLDDLMEQQEIRRYVLWYYTPNAIELGRELSPLAAVYDCMDELSAFKEADAKLQAREIELLQRVDLVFTGGHSLYRAKRTQHPAVYPFPSSVDTAHFRQAREPQNDPEDQAAIPYPRVGFYGVIDERMDLDLLAATADARPDWQIVMVGPVTKIDETALPVRDNIHYLGSKSYDELPAYLAGWDVALLPFARNEATRFISPTKLPEYLAGGKPAVSTSIRDVVHPYAGAGLVRIADSADDFVAAIEAAMAEDGEARCARVDEFLAESSWERTWFEMRSLITEAVRSSEDADEPIVERAFTPDGAGGRRDLFDYLIVGAGFAGSVLAERLATQLDKRVLIVDRRPHIAGNAYDHYDDAGVLIHRYGPHIFHTNSARIFEYLSQFTEWRPYQHRVKASVDGRLVPMPINLDTINELYGLSLTSFELESFFASMAEPRQEILTSEDVVVSRVGRELYEKFFRGYTRKQWGLDPSELDAGVTARVPTRINRDDRYFTDTYQAMPLRGYTRMFERMLDHPNIKVMLNTDYREIDGFIPYRELIYTGPIDEYFDFRYGKLPYRSLQFRFETHDVPTYQPAPVINYPNDFQYTRVTEFKYLTGQEHARTTVVYEYPQAEGDPYYPVPRPENAELYKRYKALAEMRAHVHFVGRLATYKYYNMDQVVGQALATFDRLSAQGAFREERTSGRIVRETVPSGALGRDGMHSQPRR